jgi:hypothetical protein
MLLQHTHLQRRQGMSAPVRTMALVPDVDASSVYLPLFVLDETGARRYVLWAT